MIAVAGSTFTIALVIVGWAAFIAGWVLAHVFRTSAEISRREESDELWAAGVIRALGVSVTEERVDALLEWAAAERGER